jgi:3' exoribonuclease, RNase T-like
MPDVMLDLETLSTRPESVILTIGAVKFDPWGDDVDAESGLYFRVDVDEQLVLGRHVQEETVAWWGKQTAEVREEALGTTDRVSLDDMTRSLNRFLVGVDNIWCQGPAFDIVILENLYRQLIKPTPWQFWQIRDSRTLFGVHGDPREKDRKAAHNALMDCYYQAIGVQEIYKKAKVVNQRHEGRKQ